MEFESFIKLAVVTVKVGDTVPVPPPRADGTNVGTMAYSNDPSVNDLVVWYGQAWGNVYTSNTSGGSGLVPAFNAGNAGMVLTVTSDGKSLTWGLGPATPISAVVAALVIQ